MNELQSEYQSEYVSAAMIQESTAAVTGWARDAAAYRQTVGDRAELGVAYGRAERQRLDIFKPASNAAGPVAMFIHGGYWQNLDRSYFSHMARGVNAHGITMVVAGYTLCPQATLSQIVDEIREAVAFVVQRFDRPLTICGHSAGGHLTACMLATNWAECFPSLRADAVQNGLSFSGLFALEPLVSTNLNDKLRLDADEARRLSPLFWPAPAGKSLIAYVGGDETSEFLRQTRCLVQTWSGKGVDATVVEVPKASHFGVIAPLPDPDSQLTRDLAALAKRSVIQGAGR